MSSHLKRWISGIIAVPILFAIIFYGSVVVFTAFITVVILGAVIEYNRMAFNGGFTWEKREGLIIAVLLPLAAYSGDFRIVLAVVAFSVLSVFILFLLKIDNYSFDIVPVSKLVLGLMYIPFMLSHFILLRISQDGIIWIFLILVLAFSGDITAYYVGKTVGKKKLMPLISPGKTVEGTIGLLVGSVLGCVLFRGVFYQTISIFHAVTLGLLGGILGQLGDLYESTIKRTSGVKDSGSLIIGHGGLLDRLDCLIFITPFVYYYKVFVMTL
ncbi:MAG TPA: phosphatidate cytidylyltransferase [Syntrophales bacterium]|nr:phosphatidate cytidylyltransferase [Syntrophales bacterium]